jgi:hypothetical protein
MTIDDSMNEFVADWKFAGKPPSTAVTYHRHLE